MGDTCRIVRVSPGSSRKPSDKRNAVLPLAKVNLLTSSIVFGLEV